MKNTINGNNQKILDTNDTQTNLCNCKIDVVCRFNEECLLKICINPTQQMAMKLRNTSAQLDCLSKPY